MASTYPYSKLPDGTIRILRLVADNDVLREAPIRCKIMLHDLRGGDGLKKKNTSNRKKPKDSNNASSSPYEALSYVWGSPENPRSIHLEDEEAGVSGELLVTQNLHEALRRLRDRWDDRIVWIDAICINQSDIQERNQQVAMMAHIYASASRVLVWLGEDMDEGVDSFLNELTRIAINPWLAKDNKNNNQGWSREMSGKLTTLFRRPWFRRVWIIQEVAAARSILVMCGPCAIDGKSFSRGLTAAFRGARIPPHMKPPAVTQLMDGSMSTNKKQKNDTNPAAKGDGRFTLGIAPLSGLLDRFMDNEATDPRDKVFALIGLAKGRLDGTGLTPDYNMPLRELMHRLVSFYFRNTLVVDSLGVSATSQAILLKGTGQVVGHVRETNPWAEKHKPYVWVSLQKENEKAKSQVSVSVEHLRPVQVNDLLIRLEAPAGAAQQQQQQAQCVFVRRMGNFFVLVAGNATFNQKLDWAKGENELALRHELWIVWDWSGCARGDAGTGIDYHLEDFAREHLDRHVPFTPLEVASQSKEAGLILWGIVDPYAREPEHVQQSLDSERFLASALEEYRKTPGWAWRCDADILKGVLPECERRDEIMRFWRLKELARHYFETLDLAQPEVRRSMLLAAIHWEGFALDALIASGKLPGEKEMANVIGGLSSLLGFKEWRETLVPVLAIISRHRGLPILKTLVEALEPQKDYPGNPDPDNPDAGRILYDEVVKYVATLAS